MQDGKNGPNISHSMFVDDFILFGEAIETKIMIMVDYLNGFCEISNQKVNHGKTNLFFFQKCEGRDQEEDW